MDQFDVTMIFADINYVHTIHSGAIYVVVVIFWRLLSSTLAGMVDWVDLMIQWNLY